MRRKLTEEPAPPESAIRSLSRRWLVQLLLLGLILGLLLGGVFWLGSFARDQLRDHQRFQVPFSDIECTAPVGMQKSDFLAEVQYLSRLPERFSIFDDGLSNLLQAGFAKHPWVAKVERVELVPPRSVRVTLIFRQAVLAVVVATDLAGEGIPCPAPPSTSGVGGEWRTAQGEALALRAVDIEAVLLPKKVTLDRGLPILHRAPRPLGGEGQPWGDDGVLVAAQTAPLLKSQLERASIHWMTWSKPGLILWGPSFKVLWGRPAASVRGEEASLAVKEQRLTKLIGQLEPLGLWHPWMHEFDLRPREAMADRLVLWERP